LPSDSLAAGRVTTPPLDLTFWYLPSEKAYTPAAFIFNVTQTTAIHTPVFLQYVLILNLLCLSLFG